MELFDDNSTIVWVLPGLISGLLVMESNYEALAKLVGENSDVYTQFTALVPERANSFSVDTAKNLQLTLFFGTSYTDALRIVLQNEVIDLGRGLFKISAARRGGSSLEYILSQNGVFLEGEKLVVSAVSGSVVAPTLQKDDILVDTTNWYCNCREFTTRDSGFSQQKYTQSNCITELLNSCPTKLPAKLPICCHMLAVLILSVNSAP